MEAIYQDRVDAGRRLGRVLEREGSPDTLVLGVPHGGVVVAAEVARALRAALVGLRRLSSRRLVVAVPVGPAATCVEFRELADEVVCLRMPEPFVAVGAWYADFGQTEDAEVVRLLTALAAHPHPASDQV
jgi:predicted phosphoribosyltransferase